MTRAVAGRTVAGYEIRARIGQGGMSEVYEAFDPRLRRTVAFKVLNPELSRSRTFRDRFVRESHIAGSLSHPNVIPVFEAGAEDDLLYISMHLVVGYDLGTLIAERGGLEPQLVAKIVGQAAGALDAAHEAGLLHRDVKPANLLLEKGVNGTPHVYLTDFGLTKALGRDSRITETGQLVGSVHYVSPEHVEGREMDHRADVYALGCVLYECLTGAPPFERESDMAVLWAHVNSAVPAVSQKNRRLPRLIDRVIARALAKDPAERYRTCGDLAESFAAALEGVAHDLPAPAPQTPRPNARKVMSWARRTVAVTTATVLVGALATWGAKTLEGRDPGLSTPPHKASREDPRALATETRIAAKQTRNGNDGRTSLRDGSPSRRGEVAQQEQLDVARGTGAERQSGGGTAGSSGKSAAAALEPTRTLSERYDLTTTDLRGLRDCSPDDTAQGCIVFDLEPHESQADVRIRDDAGLPVNAWIRQDANHDGRWEGSWIAVCNETSDPIALRAGARIQVLIDEAACFGDSQATTGLIELTLYRRL